ncbi:ROK family protein [Metabacillus sediminilitoris]|uniref:ROK family protein n=1 Tax=Metabacillus sediminilitoris TaxID=2567941 RepID=A0A4S4C2P8_9BACI|nr:ROK family protein [Metabacillus sediminilitoris]QGQ48227.1 ROK family protein [Metabacillus sediminilitoris]THF81414.1 ROK family protein [Metabacillus sediminilitoris]
MKTLQTGDQNLVKQINKSIVFTYIGKNGPVSRAQISKDTGLNKATVSTMVSELITDSFVYEIGAGQSSGGRKPVLLYFNNLAGYSIGIDLGVNYLLGVLTDLSGNIIEEMNIPLKETDFEYVMNEICSIIEALIKSVPESPYGIVGIGIGVPGMIDRDENILFAPNLKWRQIDLKQIIENKFNIPTKVENEANTGCYGEQLYGAGKNIANLIYLSIGIGIGGGIIINNTLYTGTSGISGEMGHLTIESNGKKCPCGNSGCWELYASESALLEESKLAGSIDGDISIDTILNEARKGNRKVLQLLNNIGEHIGIGLTNIINTFNPEMIIIGNRMALLENWITNPINRILTERLSTYHRSNTNIRFSSLGTYSSALGASSFSIAKFLSDQKLVVKS